jgi:acetyltransferase-like isoleucine patch superfamily enzyme
VLKRITRLVVSLLDPGTYVQVVRVLHFYGYSHVRPRRRVTMGDGATMAPNVSLRNGERIVVGARTKVGERAYLWAGDTHGRITIGEDCRLGPEVFVTASDYGMLPDEKIAYQARNERDIVIGNDVWLGARVFVAAGVEIGAGCVVSANSAVTRSLPPNSVAVGVPARVVRRREDYAQDAAPEETSTRAQVQAGDGDLSRTRTATGSESGH